MKSAALPSFWKMYVTLPDDIKQRARKSLSLKFN